MQIVITAQSNYSYVVELNGSNYNLTNSSATTISGLEPGNYNVCISVVNEDYKQCFNLDIEAAQEISGKTSVSSNKLSISIEQGTAPYSVYKNGVEIDETFNKLIIVDEVKNGDLVEVRTSIKCEGTLAKTIDTFNKFVAYPNPSNGSFEIGIPYECETIQVQVFNIQSQLIDFKEYKVNFGKIQLDLQDKPSGTYFVKLISNDTQVLRIVKE